MKIKGLLIETEPGIYINIAPIEESDRSGTFVYTIDEPKVYAGTIMEVDDDDNMLVQFLDGQRELYPPFTNQLYKKIESHCVVSREYIKDVEELMAAVTNYQNEVNKLRANLNEILCTGEK